MIGGETSILRLDGDNKPLTVDTVTGRVERPNTYYPAALRTAAARAAFLAIVGVAYSHEVSGLIAACNRAAGRKTLTTDDERIAAARVYAGIDPKPVRSARPHSDSCPCPRCRQLKHLSCRRLHCPVCG